MRTSLLTVVVALALLVVGLSGVSDADEGNRVTGYGYARGTTPINTQMVEGTQFDNDPHKVKGYASASPLAAGVPAGQFNGPITCFDVRGNTAGVVYVFDDTSTGFVGQAIYATGIDGGPGRPDRLGFIGPLPPSAFPDCAPRPELAILPFSGDLVLQDKSGTDKSGKHGDGKDGKDGKDGAGK